MSERRNIYLKRQELSSYTTLFRALISEGKTMFRNYLRMTPELFTILEKVKPAVKGQDTVVREGISFGARPEATLL